jgi:hypothetical protein
MVILACVKSFFPLLQQQSYSFHLGMTSEQVYVNTLSILISRFITDIKAVPCPTNYAQTKRFNRDQYIQDLVGTFTNGLLSHKNYTQVKGFNGAHHIMHNRHLRSYGLHRTYSN